MQKKASGNKAARKLGLIVMQWRRRTYQAIFHLLDCTLKRGSNLQTCRGQFRLVSTSTKNDPARIRNLAVVAHIGMYQISTVVIVTVLKQLSQIRARLP